MDTQRENQRWKSNWKCSMKGMVGWGLEYYRNKKYRLQIIPDLKEPGYAKC